MSERPKPTELPSDPPSEDEADHLWLRRGFLAKAAWVGLFATFSAACLAFVRLLFPRAPIRAPTHFAIGRPGEFGVGSVTSRLPPDGQGRAVWVVRTKKGFFALLGRCTHLGCTPRWQPAPKRFKCPCHGSVFTREGDNVSGPAPRPLERVHIELGARGVLTVDPARRYRHELGEWDEKGAFLEWTEGTDEAAS